MKTIEERTQQFREKYGVEIPPIPEDNSELLIWKECPEFLEFEQWFAQQLREQAEEIFHSVERDLIGFEDVREQEKVLCNLREEFLQKEGKTG